MLLDSKICGPKIFGPNLFLEHCFFIPNVFLPIILLNQILLDLELFLIKNIVGLKTFGSKFLGPIILSNQNNILDI